MLPPKPVVGDAVGGSAPPPGAFGSQPFRVVGLSSSQAAARLEAEGPNELPHTANRRVTRLVLDLLREPMVFLLVACGLIYMLLGDQQEAWMLLGFLGVILAITLYQEQKAERALEALRDLSSPRALVLRNGVKVRIAGREVVRDDAVFLAEGDRIPADGEIVTATGFAVDESLLTGESVPVAKLAFDPTSSDPGGPASQVFSGTTAVKGMAIVRVTKTGPASELGKIGGLLKNSPAAPTRLQSETRQLVQVIAVVAALLCVVVVAAYVLYHHPWTEGLLSALTLAMAILPNELPAVLTIFMALGAWRLSKQRVLTRRTSAIEALGTATVLCVDKAGTLTYNRMTVRKLFANGETYDLHTAASTPLPETFHDLMEYGFLAAERDPYDPMDRAFNDAGTNLLTGTEHIHPDWTLVKHFPLSPELLALSYVWKDHQERVLPAAAKGAPEAIFDLCHLPAEVRDEIGRHVQIMAGEGLRMLGVARARVPEEALPEIQHDIAFAFVGLVGLEDPVRAGVPQAMRECGAAGVRVIMITGDHPETARSIARQAGLENPEMVLTGSELSALSDQDLATRMRSINVCARMIPEQKGRLIQALKANGEIVAMTGDGVNDAPALKQANIGIAMGQRGTDVAREAAALVLLDDDFGSIVAAIKMGRRIYANLQRAMSYLLAVHIPIAGISVIPVALNLPLILMPIHVAFLHLIIEPACSIAFEAEAAADDIMQRPPRPKEQALFSWKILRSAILQGVSVLSIIMVVFAVALGRGQGDVEARTLAFATLVIANAGMIISRSLAGAPTRARTLGGNRPLRLVVGGSILLLAAVLYIPAVRDLFRFSHLHPLDLLVCLAGGVGGSLLIDLSSRWR